MNWQAFQEQGKSQVMIKPVCAKLTYDSEIFGSMDLYCKLKVGEKTEKTSVSQDTGKNPSWEDKIVFEVSNESDQVHFTLFDKDTFSDDYICEAWIPLFQNADYEGWFTLLREGEDVGKIMVCIDYL